MERAGLELELIPAKGDELADSETIAVREEEERPVAVAVAADRAGGGEELIGLVVGEVFAGAAGGWITPHRISRERLRAIVRLAHVGWLPVQVYADLALGKEHQPTVSCSTTPRPSSSLNATGMLCSRSVPRSTNAGTGAALRVDTTAGAIGLVPGVRSSRKRRHRRKLDSVIDSREQYAATLNPLRA